MPVRALVCVPVLVSYKRSLMPAVTCQPFALVLCDTQTHLLNVPGVLKVAKDQRKHALIFFKRKERGCRHEAEFHIRCVRRLPEVLFVALEIK